MKQVKKHLQQQQKLNNILIIILILPLILFSIDRLLKNENYTNYIESREETDILFKKSSFLRISDLIPPRPGYPIKVNSAEKAVEDYHQQVKNVSSLILDEYRLVMNDLFHLHSIFISSRKVCGDETNADANIPNDQK